MHILISTRLSIEYLPHEIDANLIYKLQINYLKSNRKAIYTFTFEVNFRDCP